MRPNRLIDTFSDRPDRFAWFLGAGASRSAGLPTATDIIWDLKRRHYCREQNQEISRQDIQNDAVRNRIQSFFESRGFPELLADDEYTTYFERIFGNDSERQRRYLRKILSDDRVSLSVGNRVFAALMVAGYCRVAFTTNFDSVVEKAVAEVGNAPLSAYHLEGSHSANNALNDEEYPLYCKLHGDFRYESLKNLARDLAQQNSALSDCLINAANRFGFVVAGYSGRDQSVMALFREALESPNPFPHGFFWACMKGTQLHPQVSSFLRIAQEKGVDAECIEIQTFDAFMLQLWRNIDQKPTALDAKVRRSPPLPVDIPIPRPGRTKPLLRLTSLPLLSIPEHCFALSFRSPKTWHDLRRAMSSSGGALVLTRSDDVCCWGCRDRIREFFGDDLVSISVVDVPTDTSVAQNLHLRGFLGRAVTLGLSRGRPLISRSLRHADYLIAGQRVEDREGLVPLIDVTGTTSGNVPGLMAGPTQRHPQATQVRWSEALRLSIDQKGGRLWIVVHPDIWIWPSQSRSDASDFLRYRRQDRQNSKYNSLLDAWVKVALSHPTRASIVTVRPFHSGDETENPSFRIGSRSAYTRKL